MKILFVASEVAPFAKVSAMAECTGALPVALHAHGHDVRIITPRYKVTDENAFQLRSVVESLHVPISNRIEPCAILEGTLADVVPTYFLKNDTYYQRDQLYGDSQGDYPDNAERFIYFSRSIPEVCKSVNFFPDVIHCHDWQTGLVPVYFRQIYKTDPAFAKTAFVYTIHNLGYQGLFWHYDMHLTGLGWELFTPDGLEYYGKINLMKGGLIWSHVLNTVSPTYAQEIQTREYGHGLEGVLQYRKADLTGVVNGIDTTVWNPATDPLIAATYSCEDLTGKTVCKQALLKTCGLPEERSRPVLAILSRFDNQKGFDLIAEVFEQLLEQDLYLVLAGTGHEKYQKLVRHMAEKYPRQVSLRLETDDALTHIIVAGADMLLMPSKQEPDGVTQLYALRYGTVPIARSTGILKDTIQPYDPQANTGTGVMFSEYNAEQFLTAIRTALDTYREQEHWQALMVRGMREDFSWEASANAYEQIYQKALDRLQG